MNNLRCEFCGHYNPAGAEACEECEFPAGRAAAAEAGETSSDYSAGPDETSDYFAGVGDAPPPPTAIPSPQFKGAGDVISPTLELYRKHFMLVGLLVLVTTLPTAILQYAAAAALTANSADYEEVGLTGVSILIVGLGTPLLNGVLTLLGNALLAGALAYAVVQIHRTGAARAGESLRWGLGKMLRVVAVTTPTYLVFIIAGFLLAVVGTAVGPAAALIGGLLMLAPGVWLALTLSLAAPAAAVEERGVVESIRRSAELTKGYKSLIFLTHFLWGVVIAALTLLVSGSFIAAGEADSLAPLLVQSVVVGMLTASMDVLTVYIYLGILGERRRSFEGRAFAPA